MFEISWKQINELHDILFELGIVTYLQNVICNENAENNYYLDGFEFLGKSANAFLLEKQTDAVLRLKELLFKDEFNVAHKD